MKNSHRNLTGLGTLLVCAGISSAGISSTLILDDYDSDPNDDALGAGVYTAVVFNNPYGQSSDYTIDTALSSGVDMGALVFNSGIGVEQSLFVSYDNGGAGLDLNTDAMGIEGYQMDFASVDQAFIASLRLITYDAMGNNIGNAVWGVNVDAGTDVSVEWSYGDFISITGDFDYNNIDKVEVNFNISNNTTASLDFIATEFRAVVPSPGPLALLGLGGMLIARRERM